MVVGMKTMAIEFTLTRETVFREFISHEEAAKMEPGDMGPESVRCRLLVSDDRTEIFWRARNGLAEEFWAGGFCDLGNRAERIGSVPIDQHLIQGVALRALASRLVGSPSVATVKTRELPNGAIVYDLGTV